MSIDGDSPTQLAEEPATVFGGASVALGFVALALLPFPPARGVAVLVSLTAAGAGVAALCVPARRRQPGKGLAFTGFVLVALVFAGTATLVALRAADARAADARLKADVDRRMSVVVGLSRRDDLIRTARSRGLGDDRIRDAVGRFDAELARLADSTLTADEIARHVDAAAAALAGRLSAPALAN